MNLLFLPVCCSRLNPIERLWGLFKIRWRRRLIQLDGEIQMDEEKVKEEMSLIFNHMEAGVIDGLARGWRDQLMSVVQGLPV